MEEIDEALANLPNSLPIANQTTLGGIKVGAGLSITADGILSTTGGGGTADSVNWENVVGRPTKLSQFTNDSGFITSIPSEYITETELTAKGYATTSQIPTVPTKTSQLTNDSGYATETYVTSKIAEASLSGGEVDLSGYVTKETGNASQITFADGQTFQAKLDAGTLKGDTGEQGIQGIQGEKGDKGDKGDTGNDGYTPVKGIDYFDGAKGDKGDTGERGLAGKDGLTTAISVNGTTYTHVDGVISLPNYPSNYTLPIASADTLGGVKIGEGLSIGSDGLLTATGKFSASVFDNNPLADKNIVLFGDSITDPNVNGKWVAPFRNLVTCKSLTNYARGYCTFTFKSNSEYNITDTSNSNSGNNVIWNQFNRLKNDVDNGKVSTPDLILILAGTNDAIQNLNLGDIDTAFSSSTITSTDIKTLTNLAQSVRYCCDVIHNEYPSCKIVLFTPLPLGSKSHQDTIFLVRDTIFKCAEYLGLYAIDQCKCGFTWYREASGSEYYAGDGTHLSDLGGTYVADFIYKELMSLPILYQMGSKLSATSSGGSETTKYTITNNLTNCTTNNPAITVDKNSSYTATLTANSGYTLGTPTIVMGLTDITSTAYRDGVITINDVTGNITITCSASATNACTSISLDQTTLSLTDKTPVTLRATVVPENTTDTISWSVSPTGIATVENGVVTPANSGTCVVTATCGTQTATCEVTVTLATVEVAHFKVLKSDTVEILGANTYKLTDTADWDLVSLQKDVNNVAPSGQYKVHIKVLERNIVGSPELSVSGNWMTSQGTFNWPYNLLTCDLNTDLTTTFTYDSSSDPQAHIVCVQFTNAGTGSSISFELWLEKI